MLSAPACFPLSWAPRRRGLAWNAGCFCSAIMMALLAVAPTALAQQVEDAPGGASFVGDDSTIAVARSAKKSPDGEIAVMGQIPDGDYRLFGATIRCHVWNIAVEYDRRWGHVGKIRLDYVAEIAPVTILSQPAVADFWGNGLTPQQELVPGLALSPFGLRFVFRQGRKIRPIFVGKLGVIAFTKRAFSPDATYWNINVQAAAGVQYAVNNRFDLRVEPFQFFHVSNGYLARSNPGMDQIGWRIGFDYHLRKKGW
jgi:hypothetical protein